MDPRKMVLHETLVIAAGQAVCIAVMLAVFALLRAFDKTVLLGAIVGGLLATGNFLFMSIGVSLAADRAAAQNVKGGQALISGSFLLRYGLLFLALYVGAKSGFCNPIALVLPLIFTRPILTVREFFKKRGDNVE